MEHNQKITASHLKRRAVLYIRQSTMKQVCENTESTLRQYALKGRLIALGWPEDRITVIDRDLGRSGAEVEGRDGFKQLVSDVGSGEAGAIACMECSRLSRNSHDWGRLTEICAITKTVLIDSDGVYDPGDFNDRILLGLKGTMSEAELHFIRARLNGGKQNKARRGEDEIARRICIRRCRTHRKRPERRGQGCRAVAFRLVSEGGIRQWRSDILQRKWFQVSR